MDSKEAYYNREKMGKWKRFRTFCYDGETGEILGRTGSSWGKFFRPIKFR